MRGTHAYYRRSQVPELEREQEGLELTPGLAGTEPAKDGRGAELTATVSLGEAPSRAEHEASPFPEEEAGLLNWDDATYWPLLWAVV